MRIAITGFGSVWRHRLGKQPDQDRRFVFPVYYNTTGVLVNGCLRQRTHVCSYARFDAIGGFDPNYPSKMIDRVFECAEPSVWMGCNKLLFRRVLPAGGHPDRYLVIARLETIGRLQVGREGWRSQESWLISFSEGAGQQEAMLLLALYGWIRTDLGKFVLMAPEQRRWEARLVLCADKVMEAVHALPERLDRSQHDA